MFQGVKQKLKMLSAMLQIVHKRFLHNVIDS